ncbi:triose-phosphate isomerase [Jiella endophytica]|uniref:Triosephosphate isomerase n=1 Tax=Jiella endophytica TaxID=2558362 RepID=A0A4Y8RQW7_9HYPH|nr:triose-phosphate isomerase [Jiella endophytica]TFF25077.1 triose-phosphate isomerase [Jiella endophytica]
MAPKPLIAGNWKMNGRLRELTELEAIAAGAAEAGAGKDLLICPPATILSASVGLLAGKTAIGGQDCHAEKCGAHTGDIAAEMIADLGATYVIVGHSERRGEHQETDAKVRAKVEAAWRAGLVAIVCIGESEEDHEAGGKLDVLGRQLSGSLPDGVSAANTVVAYEPIWAIGSGRTPTTADVAEVHGFLREALSERFGAEVAGGIRLLYGGSVKPDNAAELLAVENVDGALIGGASLKAEDFIAICRACPLPAE